MSTDQQRLLAIVRMSLSDKVNRFERDSDLAAAKIGELNLDSLEKLQLVMDLEAELSVMANETEVAACQTVGDLVALMLRTAARSKRNG